MIYVDAIPLHFLWALVIFAAASLTDMLDGKIARARGLVTNFENSWIPWRIRCWSSRR